MGCGHSKVVGDTQDSQLLSFCRQRRSCILSAVDNRYAFAAAHSAYILSLQTFGDALFRFVGKGFVPEPPPPPPPLASPVLKLPGDPKMEEGSLSTSLSHSLSHRSFSASHLNFDSHDSETDSPIHSPTKRADGSPANELPVLPTMNYVKSTAIPSMVFVKNMPFQPSETVTWVESGWSFAEPNTNRAFQSPPPPSPPPNPPPPPPPPATNVWDFFNPFVPFEDMYRFYHADLHESPDSSEVRLQEGIPDLEDELQVENVKQVDTEQKTEAVVDKHEDTENGSMSGHILIDEDDEDANKIDGISTVSPRKDDDPISVSEEPKSEGTTSSVLHHMKGIGFRREVVLEGREKSGKVEDFTPLAIKVTRDIMEAVGEIKGHFVNASQSGSEVSALLQVGKLRYRPKIRMSQFFESPKKGAPSLKDMNVDFKMRPDNLLAVLDEICTWENKLFEEIKNEEQIRLAYEKHFKRLKDLNTKGAEPDKLQVTQASIRMQLTKINMSIRAINTISGNIHRLRDDVLQRQLPTLVEGMMKMWKAMMLCHQNQLQSISEVKILDIMLRNVSREAAMKAVTHLELGVRQWCSSFVTWTHTQVAFVESLNDWLLKCIDQEPELTADGVVPFSPSRVGAPPIFVLCSDWYQMTKNLRVDGIISTVNAFTESMHKLHEHLDEEHNQSLKIEFLARNLQRQQSLLQQQENQMHLTRDHTDKSTVLLGKHDDISLSHTKMVLDETTKKLDEERLKHVEVIRKIQDGAFATLKIGLVQIFEAMTEFSSSTVKAYENIRISYVGNP